MFEIARCVKYEFVPAYEIVCEYGEVGNDCRIVLSGSCDVIKPVLMRDLFKSISPNIK